MRLFPAKRLEALLLMTMTLMLALVPGTSQAAENEGILRLHVIANSDSAADQQVKLLVRDAVLALLPASRSAEEARAFLLGNGRLLLDTVESTLRENGFSYSAQLRLGTCAFPDRMYGDILYRAGDYDALRIVLGRGAGQNWWCVLFPPLCIVTGEREPLPDGDALVFESSLLKWIRAWREKK